MRLSRHRLRLHLGLQKIYDLHGVSPGEISGNLIYYGAKVALVVYLGLMAAIFLFGNLDQQGWRIVMASASLIASTLTTIYALMTYASFKGYSIAAAVGNAEAVARVKTALRFNKIGAMYAAILTVLPPLVFSSLPF